MTGRSRKRNVIITTDDTAFVRNLTVSAISALARTIARRSCTGIGGKIADRTFAVGTQLAHILLILTSTNHPTPDMPDASSSPSTTRSHWQAQLSLGFIDDAGTTRLTEREHRGPLRVQKALYPEHPSVCHAVIVHPPGGVVGGDQLDIAVRVGSQASVFISTPGAAKWYRANGHVSRQSVRLEVAAGASLEWMPQETIFFNNAHVRLNSTITLHGDATYVGCDILCFGRTASGETFNAGTIAQHSTIRRDGKLIWFEQGRIDGAGNAMHSPLGLAGKTVCATLLVAGKTITPVALATLRETLGPQVGITHMKSILVVRHLGDSSEHARRLMMQAWQALRPLLLAREAVVPRIWNT
ncbi:MAG: urease accessory protein [Burkholderiaceae bacterium]|jgi:urease accessory protein